MEPRYDADDVYWVAVVTARGDRYFQGPFDGLHGADDADLCARKSAEIGHRAVVIGQP